MRWGVLNPDNRKRGSKKKPPRLRKDARGGSESWLKGWISKTSGGPNNKEKQYAEKNTSAKEPTR